MAAIAPRSFRVVALLVFFLVPALVVGIVHAHRQARTGFFMHRDPDKDLTELRWHLENPALYRQAMANLDFELYCSMGKAAVTGLAIYVAVTVWLLGQRPKRVFVVGLSGYGRAGKDTAADAVCKLYPRAAQRAFADALRNIASQLNPLLELATPQGNAQHQRYVRYNDAIERFTYDNAKNPAVVKDFRKFLVALGEAVRNHLSPSTWLDKVVPSTREEIDRLYAENGCVVVSDARYSNEAEHIQRMGGLVIMIVRPGVEAADDTEARNVARVAPDIIIHNNRTIEDLAAILKRVCVPKFIGFYKQHGYPLEVR